MHLTPVRMLRTAGETGHREAALYQHACCEGRSAG